MATTACGAPTGVDEEQTAQTATPTSTGKCKTKQSRGRPLDVDVFFKDHSPINWAEEMEKELATSTSTTTLEQRMELVAVRQSLPTKPRASRDEGGTSQQQTETDAEGRAMSGDWNRKNYSRRPFQNYGIGGRGGYQGQQQPSSRYQQQQQQQQQQQGSQYNTRQPYQPRHQLRGPSVPSGQDSYVAHQHGPPQQAVGGPFYDRQQHPYGTVPRVGGPRSQQQRFDRDGQPSGEFVSNFSPPIDKYKTENWVLSGGTYSDPRQFENYDMNRRTQFGGSFQHQSGPPPLACAPGHTPVEHYPPVDHPHNHRQQQDPHAPSSRSYLQQQVPPPPSSLTTSYQRQTSAGGGYDGGRDYDDGASSARPYDDRRSRWGDQSYRKAYNGEYHGTDVQQQQSYSGGGAVTNRYGPSTDRYSQPPSVSGGSMQRGGVRDYQSHGGGGRPHFDKPYKPVGASRRPSESRTTDVESAVEVKERPKLVLKPRTIPIAPEINPPPPAHTEHSSQIFGSAKPVDTRRREEEIELRLLSQRQHEREKKDAQLQEQQQTKKDSIPEIDRERPRQSAQFQKRQQARTVSGSSLYSSPPIDDVRPILDHYQQHSLGRASTYDDVIQHSSSNVGNNMVDEPQVGHVTILRRTVSSTASTLSHEDKGVPLERTARPNSVPEEQESKNDDDRGSGADFKMVHSKANKHRYHQKGRPSNSLYQVPPRFQGKNRQQQQLLQEQQTYIQNKRQDLVFRRTKDSSRKSNLQKSGSVDEQQILRHHDEKIFSDKDSTVLSSARNNNNNCSHTNNNNNNINNNNITNQTNRYNRRGSSDDVLIQRNYNQRRYRSRWPESELNVNELEERACNEDDEEQELQKHHGPITMAVEHQNAQKEGQQQKHAERQFFGNTRQYQTAAVGRGRLQRPGAGSYRENSKNSRTSRDVIHASSISKQRRDSATVDENVVVGNVDSNVTLASTTVDDLTMSTSNAAQSMKTDDDQTAVTSIPITKPPRLSQQQQQQQQLQHNKETTTLKKDESRTTKRYSAKTTSSASAAINQQHHHINKTSNKPPLPVKTAVNDDRPTTFVSNNKFNALTLTDES